MLRTMITGMHRSLDGTISRSRGIIRSTIESVGSVMLFLSNSPGNCHVQIGTLLYTFFRLTKLQSLRQLAHKLTLLPADDPHRVKHEALLFAKLHDIGLLSSTTATKLSDVENKITVSAFCRRRLPVIMTRLRMAETVQAATKIVEQGHVRVGTETVSDPAYLVTRGMEDFVTWVDGSKIRRNILQYREKLDDFDLL